MIKNGLNKRLKVKKIKLKKITERKEKVKKKEGREGGEERRGTGRTEEEALTE